MKKHWKSGGPKLWFRTALLSPVETKPKHGEIQKQKQKWWNTEIKRNKKNMEHHPETSILDLDRIVLLDIEIGSYMLFMSGSGCWVQSTFKTSRVRMNQDKWCFRYKHLKKHKNSQDFGDMSISILNEDLHEVQKHGEVDCHGLKWVYQLLWNQAVFKTHAPCFFCITNLVTNFVTNLHILSCFCCFSAPDESRSAYFSSNSDSGAELTELTHHSPDTMRLWLYTNGGNIWKRPLLPLGHATMWSCPIWDYLLYSSHSWSGFTATRLHFSWKTNYTNKIDEESCQDAKDDHFMIHL